MDAACVRYAEARGSCDYGLNIVGVYGLFVECSGIVAEPQTT